MTDKQKNIKEHVDNDRLREEYTHAESDYEREE